MKWGSKSIWAWVLGAAMAAVSPAHADPSDFSGGISSFRAGHWLDAAESFRAYLASDSDGQYAPEAHFRHAACLNRLGRFGAARMELQSFLEESPTSPLKRQATVELAFADSNLGHKDEATEMLRPVLPELTAVDRKAEATILPLVAPDQPAPVAPTPTASTGKSALDELRRLAHSSDTSSFEQVLETQATFLDVATIYAEHDTSSPSWGLIAAKMARIDLHLGYLDKAKQAADLAAQAGYRSDALRAVYDQVAQTQNVKPNLVGVILPLSGRFKPYGEQLQNGLNLALGGDESIRLVVRDSQGDPDAAVAAVDALAQQGVIAIIGPVGTQEAIPAAIRAQQLGIPMLSLSRAEGVTDAGTFVFRNSLTNSAQGRALALYASEVLEAKHAAILAPDIPAGQEVTKPFWSSFEAKGGEVRGYETYPQDETTFAGPLSHLIRHGSGGDALKEQIEHIKATVKNAYRRKKLLSKLEKNAPPIVDFDVLLIPDYYRTVLQIAPSIAVDDVITNGCDKEEMERIKRTTHVEDVRTVTLLGTAGWDSPDLIARGGRYVECSVVVDGFYAGSNREATRAFVSAYREHYNQDPGLLEAQAYDSARIVKQILDTDRPTTRDAFREALLHLHDFPGATGDTTMAPDREADKPLFFLVVGKSGFSELPVQISPEGIAAPVKASER